MRAFVLFVIVACALAAEVEDKKEATPETQNKDKRQTHEDVVQAQLIYRAPRKQELAAPVEEEQEREDDDDKIITATNRAGSEQYRPGQVFSLNVRELLDLQPERKAPVSNNQQLQHLYATPQPEQKLTLQPQFYYIDPHTSRQITLTPSRTVIARPSSSSNGGEASVGAALSVSDSGASSSSSTFDEELLALLGQPPARQEETRPQVYAQPAPQVSTQSIASQYQQIDRYTVTKPTKKPTKLQAKVQINPPQSATAPQQYLIETTNVAQQQQKLQPQQQYKYVQPQKAIPTFRYVPIAQAQPVQQAQVPQFAFYNPPESQNQNQGLKIVAPPKLQQPRAQFAYRFVPQYEQDTAKQYRILEARPTPEVRPREQTRIPASSIDRPVAYLKRFPEPEKTRAVKIYEPSVPEGVSPVRQPQIIGDQYYYRQAPHRPAEQRIRYVPQYTYVMEPYIEPTKPPQSTIYVNKNVAPKKVVHQPQYVRLEQAEATQVPSTPAPQKAEHVNIEQHGQSLEERRAQLPPPKNNKAYTPEEFAALVAAGYSVTPVPVGSLNSPAAQSRSSLEAIPVHRRLQNRRHQYLPLRSDEAP